jgi:hypothetical protein
MIPGALPLLPARSSGRPGRRLLVPKHRDSAEPAVPTPGGSLDGRRLREVPRRLATGLRVRFLAAGLAASTSWVTTDGR